MKNVYLLFALFLLQTAGVIAQCTLDPNADGSPNCSAATLMCCEDFTTISGTLPNGQIPFGPNPLCPGSNSVPNNIEWFSFVAGTTVMTFDVNFSNCIQTQPSGFGAQLGVYEGCDFGISVYCNGDANLGQVIVNLPNLVIGEIYYMFFDGFAGAICDYTVDLVAGAVQNVPPGDVNNIVGSLVSCSFDTNNPYTASFDFGSNAAQWVVSNPTVEFVDMGAQIVITNWGNASGSTVEICAEGINDCSPSQPTLPFCIQVQVDQGSFFNATGEYCSLEAGYVFPEDGQLYTAGVYVIEIDNPMGGCPIFYELIVEVLPSENINESFFLDLGEIYSFNGTPYLAPFFGQIDNGQIGTNGCPQTTTLELTTYDPNPQIIALPDSIIDCNDPTTLSAQHEVAANLSYTYHWETIDGCILSAVDSPIITIACGGQYDLTITTTGPGQSGVMSIESTASIFITDLSPIDLTMSGSDLSCIDEGTAMVTAVGGAPPYTYLWSNNEVTPEIINLSAGQYSVTVTDSDGCEAVETITINSVFDLVTSSTFTSCDINDGTATATIIGTVTDPLFAWNNGQSGPTATGLAPDFYSVTVTDQDNGCVTHENVQVIEDPACSVVISGNVVIDQNEDCIRDPNNELLQNIRIDLSDGQVVYTNVNGQYSFIAEPGTYQISISNFNSGLELLCDSILTVDAPTIGESYEDNDFYLNYAPQVDLQIKVVKFAARPGFTHQVRICLMNIGGAAASGTLTLNHPDQIDFISANPQETSYDSIPPIITWDFVDIPPGAVWIYTPKFSVPVDLPLGTSLDYFFEANVSGTVDLNLANNSKSCSLIVTGSYDPNDKSVDPAGEGPEGLIANSDSLMSYTIRFQNTGTDTAFTVLLRDTLSDNLNSRSLIPGPASHDYTARIVRGNILEVLFENIMLPDSFVNEPASNGFFIFDIALKRDLTPGSVINNNAGIYFDFNSPIITNTTVNTIREIVGVKTAIEPINFDLFPNPTNSQIHMDINLQESETVSVHLFNLVGEKIVELYNGESLAKGSHRLTSDLALFDNGIYFIEIKTKTGKSATKKIIKVN